MAEFIIRVMDASEKDRALELIATDDLRPEGILEQGTKYWGAYRDGTLVGMIGCEYQNSYGLLRSAMVDRSCRSEGIGGRLTQALFADAKARGLKEIYLFSTEAAPYWLQRGFAPTTVQEVDERLGDAPQVRLFREFGWLPTERVYKRRV